MLKNPKIAFLRSSSKPFERRLPIHPVHFELIDPLLRKYCYVEKDYAEDFGYPDSFFESLGVRVEERNTLIASADCVLMVRPMPKDLLKMKKHAKALGWFHCTQNQDMAEAAISNKLTTICMEALVDDEGYFFKENSIITGKQAILHIAEIGTHVLGTGQKAIVIGHSNAGIGAMTALLKHGVEVICCSKRTAAEIEDKVTGVAYQQIRRTPRDSRKVETIDGRPLLDLLKEADIIINAAGQDIHSPLFYLGMTDLHQLKKGALIIDISCDKKMGFEFARLTTFAEPLIQLNEDGILYYAIDHLPTRDYDNASRSISTQLLKILPDLLRYTIEGQSSETIKHAIQINNGEVINPDIAYFKKAFC